MKDTIKLKKYGYILLCVSVIMIMSGSFSSFLLGLQADHETVLRRMDDVSSEFEAFSTNTSVFEDFRDELYNDVLGSVYYDTMFQEEGKVKEKLSNYENIVDQIEKSTKKMDDLCENVYFPNSEVNNMCVNYKSIYEQVVNYFVSDIHTYNDNIKKFNDYQKSNGSNNLVTEYTSSKRFIDYNGDKVFDGKEE